MKVLAIDPGERVGWAVGEVAGLGGGEGGATTLVVEKHGISALKDFALALYRAVVIERTYDVVVFETFRIAAKKARAFGGNDMPTIQLIGMIRLCCWIGGVQCVSQGPVAKTSARISLAHNPELRQKIAGIEKHKHDDAHDGDALLHLWNYYFERYF